MWRGLTTIAGSWIGGGANQTAMYEVFDVSSGLFAQMIAVDVIIANIWMGFILYGSQKHAKIDAFLKADHTPIKKLERKLEDQQAGKSVPVTVPRLMTLLAIAFGVSGLSHFLADIIAPYFQENYL